MVSGKAAVVGGRVGALYNEEENIDDKDDDEGSEQSEEIAEVEPDGEAV